MRKVSTPARNRAFSMAGSALAGPTVATILARLLRCMVSSAWIVASTDQDGADIIDIGQRRPRSHEIAERIEVAVVVMGGEIARCVKAKRAASRERTGRYDRAGSILGAVDPIAVASDWPNPRLRLVGNCKGQQKLGIPRALTGAVTPDGYCRLVPESRSAGGATGKPWVRIDRA